MDKPNFQQIPPLIGFGSYSVSAEFSFVLQMLQRYESECGLDLDPEFQRGYVWTEDQKTSYVEFILKGGNSGRDILFNCPFFLSANDYDKEDPLLNRMVIVDGKQRLSAVTAFLRDELKVFGHYRSEFAGTLRTKHRLNFHVNELSKREDILRWYLELNTGGTVHTEDDLSRARRMLSDCQHSVTPVPTSRQGGWTKEMVRWQELCRHEDYLNGKREMAEVMGSEDEWRRDWDAVQLEQEDLYFRFTDEQRATLFRKQ